MSKIKQLFLAGLLVLSAVLIGAQVTAQQNQPGSGLSISPLHNRLNLDPGDSQNLTINLKNITTGSVVAKPFINDFTSDNQTGNPVIITDQKNRSPNSIQGFVSGLENIPLEPNEQKKVNVTVSVPENVSPGAYYGIIRYQAVPVGSEEAGEGDVSLSASVATIVLIQVEGDLVNKIELSTIRVYRQDRDGVLFFNKPDQIGIEIKNLGNGFAEPFGSVIIEDMSGKTVHSYQVNTASPRANVLPSSTRIFKDKIEGVNKFGRYKVTASISYAGGADVLALQKTFWYIPLWLFLAIIAVLVIVLVAAYLAFRRFRHGRRGFGKKSRSK